VSWRRRKGGGGGHWRLVEDTSPEEEEGQGYMAHPHWCRALGLESDDLFSSTNSLSGVAHWGSIRAGPEGGAGKVAVKGPDFVVPHPIAFVCRSIYLSSYI
jgi:hypothetical protein